MKALVIETAFLGDAVISIALAEALKKCEPAAHATYLVRPEAAELLKRAPAIDSVVGFDKYATESGLKGLIEKSEELNRSKFDVVFSLHTSKRTAMLLERLDAPRKIGYGSLSSLTENVEESPGIQHTARAVSLVKMLFPNVVLNTLPKLNVDDVALPKEFDGITRPLAVIAPGSVWATKRWLPERFAEVANSLYTEGYAVAFIGSPSDIETMGVVRKKLAVPHIDLIGKTSVVEAAAVISRSKILVANDSAPVHIAAALNVPTVAVFGPTVREFGFAPPSGLGAIVEDEMLWCRPCASHGSNECPTHTHECMTSISSDKVLASVRIFTEHKKA